MSQQKRKKNEIECISNDRDLSQLTIMVTSNLGIIRGNESVCADFLSRECVHSNQEAPGVKVRFSS